MILTRHNVSLGKKYLLVKPMEKEILERSIQRFVLIVFTCFFVFCLKERFYSFPYCITQNKMLQLSTCWKNKSKLHNILSTWVRRSVLKLKIQVFVMLRRHILAFQYTFTSSLIYLSPVLPIFLMLFFSPFPFFSPLEFSLIPVLSG